jgi:dethiobiotin synthetase
MTDDAARIPVPGAHATRVVVLGTGTGVGKTWVTRTLAEALRRRSAFAIALKPIESGIGDDATRSASDASLLARASSVASTPPPFTFSDPISPHLAARRAGHSIELERVVRYVSENENAVTSHVTSFVLVETAGGALTPLAPGITNFDLALALEPAVWILVAPDALGVLHDVSATLEALSARGRSPDVVVLSEAREPDASTGTNAAELRELGIAAPVAVAARGDGYALDVFAATLIAQPKTAENR